MLKKIKKKNYKISLSLQMKKIMLLHLLQFQYEKKNLLKIIVDNLKTLFGALIIAVLIRSLIIQPFYIPSSSMEPTLL